MGTAFKESFVNLPELKIISKIIPKPEVPLHVAANLHTQLICHIKDVRNFI